jgi:Flp pilus assembly protein TadG
VVEFAVCTPVLVLITLAFIDLTNFIYFRQAIKLAVYDAARMAAEPSAQVSDVQDSAARLLQTRGIENWSLDIPSQFDSFDRGDMMTLELTVPVTEVTHFSNLGIFQDGNVSVSLSVVKE